MAEASARLKASDQPALVDIELEHLPADVRWREWTLCVEAVVFAASEHVTRKVLARVVGKSCDLDLVTDEIRAELAKRRYELVAVAGRQHRAKKVFGDITHAAFGGTAREGSKELSQAEALVLMCIAYFQPTTRGELSSFFRQGGVARPDRRVRAQDLIASGSRDPQPGAPQT
ncbi:SMC-Scp complex subunit ScpB [Mesorhizobium sp. M0166]|uniref:SMC-Scp complex subunit ScpB n=1 Tax=unclassified Mesorhizobium TaxID=325217 RepID=UPI00333A1DBD